MPLITDCQHPDTRHNTMPVPSPPQHTPFDSTGSPRRDIP